MTSTKLTQPPGCFRELVERRREDHPDVAGALETLTRQHKHRLLFKQLSAQVDIAIEAEQTTVDTHHGVHGALRGHHLQTLHTFEFRREDAGMFLQQQHGFLVVILGRLHQQRFDDRLHEGARPQGDSGQRVQPTTHLVHLAVPVVDESPPDAPARHHVLLGDAAHLQHRHRRRQRTQRVILTPIKHHVGVNLVPDDGQVVFLGDTDDVLELRAREDAAGGVRGVVDQYRPRRA
mmetsp:Transcript_28562/g.82367  ORF Transcript_28562/g.82367 Transcript_28562/m.82367 type:complete len:234 (+) Transcript_28562:1506-2207(+)